MSGKHKAPKPPLGRSTDALIHVVNPHEGLGGGAAPMFEGHWLSTATNISLSSREAKKLCLGSVNVGCRAIFISMINFHFALILYGAALDIIRMRSQDYWAILRFRRPRKKLSAFLSHPVVSGVLIGLILLDVALVIAEVSLDAGKVCKLPEKVEAPEMPHEEAPIIEPPVVETPPTGTPPNASTAPTYASPTYSSGPPMEHVEMCTLACNTTIKPEYSTQDHEKAAHILHYISLSILIFFAAEIFLSIVALGHLVFSRWIVLLDAVVITVSIVIDVVLHDAAGAIIVIVRLWRVARIVHGVFETLYEKLNDKIEELKEKLKSKKEKIKALKLQLQSMEALAGGVSGGVATSPVERKRKSKKTKKPKQETHSTTEEEH